MGISFLAPLFLAGLAAVAIPILVHLTHRPQREAHAFPSLMFLSRIPFRTTRRQRIRHWWLLLLRVGFVVLVTAAFARPLLLRWGSGGTALAGGREVVILLDRSYSMGYGDRWPRALAAARRAVNGLGPSDRCTIIVFADQAQALQPATADRAALLASLDAARLSFGATRYGSALQLARDVLDQSTLPRRELVVISDFQRAGWRADEAAPLPPGTSLLRVNLSDPGAGNLAVTGVLVDRAHRGAREEVTISARIANLGREAATALPVSLDVDGRVVQTLTTSVEARSTAVARFAALPLAGQPLSVTVQAGTDQLPLDNQYHSLVTPGDVIRVLMLASALRSDEGPYLRRALGVSLEPRFEVDVQRAPDLAPANLAGHGVAILYGSEPGPRATALLAEFVRRGGALLAVLGGRGSPERSSAEWRELMGGAPGAAVEPAGAGGAGLAALTYDHPVFEAFRAPRSGDFGSARVYRYRRFQPAQGAAVLAQYEDGSPALIEHAVGSGRVLAWTSDLDNVWTDLPVQPVFLPLAHQMLRYLAGYTERRAAFTVGQLMDLGAARQTLATAGDVAVESPSGRRMALSKGAAVTLEEPGFYTLRVLGATGAGKTPQVLAVNVDPAEADLTPLDPEAFAAATTPAGPAGGGEAGGASDLSPAERERRQGVWWYLLVGAVVLALAETFLSNRLPAIGRAGA